MPEERIQKILARAGVASRRAAEELIRAGRVSVNGQTAALGAKADPARDVIRVDGERLNLQGANLIYIALYKPIGVVSAASPQRQEKRPTVLDLVKVEERLYPVGRLDADSEGLILLTNDGALTQRLTHPRYGHRKTYRVLVQGNVTSEVLSQWEHGVELDDGPTGPVNIRLVSKQAEGTWLEVVMSEGRKRQIRRTASALHLHVSRLIRTKIGALEIRDLKPGEWRNLTEGEIAALKRNPAPMKSARPRAPFRPNKSVRGREDRPAARAEDRPSRPSGKPAGKLSGPDEGRSSDKPGRGPGGRGPAKPGSGRGIGKPGAGRGSGRPPRGSGKPSGPGGGQRPGASRKPGRNPSGRR